MMTLAGIVGHNPVGACAKQTTHHFWRYQGILVNDRGRLIQGGTLISGSFTKWSGSHDEHEEHEREHEGKHERITQTNKNKSHIC